MHADAHDAVVDIETERTDESMRVEIAVATETQRD